MTHIEEVPDRATDPQSTRKIGRPDCQRSAHGMTDEETQMTTLPRPTGSRPRASRGTHRVCSAHALATATIGLLLLADAGAASAAPIAVDASKTTGNPRFWTAAVGTGTASLTLRGDLQTHYKIGNREAGFQRVRGHGLLSDAMGMYKSAGSYDFTKFDTYLAAITSAGMRPVIELDFMPTALGTSGDKSPPKDYSAWKAFITALTQRCVDKHGADEVGKWYFEVWNEPDYSGFWLNTDMAAYYTLYDNTVDALTAVLPNVLVGGPATTGPGPIKAFLQHCKSANKRVTFASSHNYPGGDGTKTSSTSADAAGLVSDNNTRVSGITGAGYTTTDVKSFNTEWNSSYSGQGGNPADVVVSMDNHWNVGFILKAVKLLSDKSLGDTPALDVFSYWALSDVFDESSGPSGSYILGKNNGNLPFGQVFGLMTAQGMRKAAFNAFKLLNYLGPKRLQTSGGASGDGVDAMATLSDAGDELQILVYNYYKKLNTSGSDSVIVEVSNLPSALAGKDVFVTQFLVDETHSNPYSVWASLNKPGSPTEDQWQKMRSAQHLALMQPVATKTVDTAFSTTFTLNRQAGTLIILGTKRPLTGRNALVEIEGEDFDGQSGATKKDSSDSTLGQSISVSSGSYAYFEKVDYTDSGVNAVQLRVKTPNDTSLELRADTQTGTLLGKCTVSSTSNVWATQTCTLSPTVTGVATLYVVFGGVLELNWLKFQAGPTVSGTGGAGAGGATGGSGGSVAGGAGGNASGGAGGSAGGGSSGSTTGGSGGSARGGAGGSATGGSGGSARGGSSGSAMGGAGGSATGGSGGSANGGSGGNSGVGGSATSGGAASGCSCRTGNSGEPSGTLPIVGFVAAVFGLRRQRARR
jgi:xylan 1,4-beta-xylosidase